MCARVGLEVVGPDESAPVPADAASIHAAFLESSASRVSELAKWTDEIPQQSDEMYGMTWKRGETLSGFVLHNTHHRGQMTVLMRQAGLEPPGIYRPAKEDWAKMGMEPPPS